MGNSRFLNNEEILDTLRELNAGITQPLWLFGGVAVDFLVGRWTRPHGDIDLYTFADFRPKIVQELEQMGYQTSSTGWLTHWYKEGSDLSLEIVFVERGMDGTAELHIREGDPVGEAGVYPLVPDHLNINRFAELDGVCFRVSSPVGEWLARANGLDVVGDRPREPKLTHDLRLLESVLSSEQLADIGTLCKAAGEKKISPNAVGD